MVWRLTFPLTLLLSLAIGGSLALAADYDDRLMFADGLYARDMHELALKEYAAILKSFPEGEMNDAVTFRLAECLRLQGDTGTAGRFYSHVVVNFRESPFRLRAAYRRARLYADEGDLDSAIAHFRVILAETPPADLAAAARYYLGETLWRHGDPDAADAAFATLVETHPDSEFAAYALMKRADVRRDRWIKLFKAEDTDAKTVGAQAILFYEQARAQGGTDRISAEALFQMAEIHFRQQDYARSAQLYRDLLERYPADERSIQARMQAAWSALNAELYAESLAIAGQALADEEVGELHDEWLYLKANSHRQLLQHEQAVRTYALMLSRFPDSRLQEAARYEMAVSHFQAGAYDEAVREAEKVRMTPALRADVCWLLAESYAALDLPDEATQYYRIVVRESAGASRGRDALYRLAHQLQKQSSYREASRFYLVLVSQYPDDALAPKALFSSAFCLARAGAHDEAVRDWRRLAQAFPEHELVEDSLYQKAMGEIRLERRDDAASTLVELRRRFPESRFAADAHYWQGMMLYEQAKYAEAEQALQKAREAAVRDELRQESMFQLGLVLQKLDRPEDAAAVLQELVATPLSGRFPPSLLEWLAAYHGERDAYDRMLQAASLLAASEVPGWQQAGGVLSGRAQLALGQQREAEHSFLEALATGATTQYGAEAALQLGRLAIAREAGDEADRFFHEASKRAADAGAQGIRARALMGLGHAAVLTGSHEDASRYFLSVAILYDDEELVPESLYLAAEAFERLGRADERDKTAGELAERYPQSTWTEKARAAWSI